MLVADNFEKSRLVVFGAPGLRARRSSAMNCYQHIPSHQRRAPMSPFASTRRGDAIELAQPMGFVFKGDTP